MCLPFQEIERLSDEAISLDDKFDSLEQDLDTHQLGNNVTDTDNLIREHETKRAVLDNVGHPLIQRGEHLISSIKANEPPLPPSQNFPGSPASMPSQEGQQVEGIVMHLKLRCDQLMDMWEKRWKELRQCMDLREFEAGYQKVQSSAMGLGGTESHLGCFPLCPKFLKLWLKQSILFQLDVEVVHFNWSDWLETKLCHFIPTSPQPIFTYVGDWGS